MRASDIIPPDFVPIFRIYPELELWYHNVNVAEYVALNALALGDDRQRQRLLQCVQPEYMGGDKHLKGFLFRIMRDLYLQHHSIDLVFVTAQIPQFGPLIYGEPSSEDSVQGDLHNWHLALSLNPTGWEVEQAIAMIHIVAERKKLLDRSTCLDAPQLEHVPPWHRGMAPTLPALDLDLELFEHERGMVADLVVLAALARGDPNQRDFIFTRLQANYLALNFEVFLYQAMQRQYQDEGRIGPEQVRQQIRDFIPWEGDEPLNAEQVGLYQQRWDALLVLAPTPRQVAQAVALRLKIAQATGLI